MKHSSFPTAGLSALLALASVSASTSLAQTPQRAILFDSDRTGQSEIYVLDATTSAVPRQLTNTPGAQASSSFAGWSPDGRRIAFVLTVDGNADLAVMGADGSDVRRVTTGPASDLYPAWSPDGSHIAFVSDRDGNRESYVIKAAGTGHRRTISVRRKM